MLKDRPRFAASAWIHWEYRVYHKIQEEIVSVDLNWIVKHGFTKLPPFRASIVIPGLINGYFPFKFQVEGRKIVEREGNYEHLTIEEEKLLFKKIRESMLPTEPIVLIDGPNFGVPPELDPWLVH